MSRPSTRPCFAQYTETCNSVTITFTSGLNIQGETSTFSLFFVTDSVDVYLSSSVSLKSEVVAGASSLLNRVEKPRWSMLRIYMTSENVSSVEALLVSRFFLFFRFDILTTHSGNYSWNPSDRFCWNSLIYGIPIWTGSVAMTFSDASSPV